MDVHPPHTPIHGWKDFFIHLGTITIGLLIALSLEAMVTGLHHDHQAHQAEATIEAEVRSNRAALEHALADYVDEQKDLETLLGAVAAARHGRTGVPLPALGVKGAALTRSSYDTAVQSGALALVASAQAKKFADTYELQSIFNTAQSQTVFGAEAPVLGAAQRMQGGLAGMNLEELMQLEEKLEHLNGQVIVLQGVGRELDKNYHGYDAGSTPE